jgi:hypothetical protein
VIPKALPHEKLAKCLTRHPLFGFFERHELTSNMRVNADETLFIEWLRNLGNGQLTEFRQLAPSTIRLSKKVVLQSPSNDRPANVQDLIDFVWDDEFFRSGQTDPSFRAILCPLNEDALAINEHVHLKNCKLIAPGEEIF